jgi:hypothetical protein
MIMTALSQLFASMATQKRPSVILGGEEIVVEVYSDALSDIVDGEHDSSHSSSVIIDERVGGEYT